MQYGRRVDLPIPFAQAVAAMTAALADQGFGVLTEIDVRATLRAKIGREIEDYVILGACNPRLAARVLDIDRSIGLLLPCNVVVRSAGAGSTVEVLDPQVMVSVPERAELQPIADEASRRLTAALSAVETMANT